MASLLLIEDDPDIREALVEFLTDCGHKTVAIPFADEALHWLATHPLPNAIVCDLTLPRMTGAELREALLEHKDWARIPFVLVTAARPLPAEIARLRIDGFAAKPLELDELLATIDRVTAGREAETA